MINKKLLKTFIIIMFFCVLIFSQNPSTNLAFQQAEDVDLLYEPLTYTPYWYKGSALPTIKSLVKVVAIPSSPNLIYDWHINNKKQFGASGLGKDLFIFEIKNYDDYNITIKIYNDDKSIFIEKAVVLSASQIKPEIIFYEENPLMGTIFNNALKENFNLFAEAINIIAEPFYFSDINQLDYDWEMNNKNIAPQEDNPQIINMEVPVGVSGTSNISLKITNLINQFQSASKNINITF